MKDLIEQGANVSATDSFGFTSLHKVIWSVYDSGHIGSKGLEKCQLLIDSGADVNARDRMGNTPLHIVLSSHRIHGFFDLALFLIEKGADIYAENYNGVTCCDLAKKHSTWHYHRMVEKVAEVTANNSDKVA